MDIKVLRLCIKAKANQTDDLLGMFFLAANEQLVAKIG